jgi:hypothetical protein
MTFLDAPLRTRIAEARRALRVRKIAEFTTAYTIFNAVAPKI